MLSLYRRHAKDCSHFADGRKWKRCKCPIWVDGTHMGAEVRQSMKTRTWVKAEQDLTEMKDQPTFKSESPKTVKAAGESFMADIKSRNLRREVVGKYKYFVDKLVEFSERIGKAYIQQLTFEDMSNFRAEWPDGPMSSSNKLSKLKSLFRYAMHAGWVKQDPTIGIRRPKVADCPTMPFTRAEMDSILQACASSPDLKSFVLAMRYTGLRIGDAVSLDASKLGRGNVMIPQQKTGRLVYVPIPPFVEESIRSMGDGRYFYWDGEIKLECATDKWRRRLRKVFKAAGIEGGRPHRFRDTFSIELLLAGVPIEDVSILLGHRTIRTTERSYAPWVQARQERLESRVRSTFESEDRTK